MVVDPSKKHYYEFITSTDTHIHTYICTNIRRSTQINEFCFMKRPRMSCTPGAMSISSEYINLKFETLFTYKRNGTLLRNG